MFSYWNTPNALLFAYRKEQADGANIGAAEEHVVKPREHAFRNDQQNVQHKGEQQQDPHTPCAAQAAHGGKQEEDAFKDDGDHEAGRFIGGIEHGGKADGGNGCKQQAAEPTEKAFVDAFEKFHFCASLRDKMVVPAHGRIYCLRQSAPFFLPEK